MYVQKYTLYRRLHSRSNIVRKLRPYFHLTFFSSSRFYAFVTVLFFHFSFLYFLSMLRREFIHFHREKHSFTHYCSVKAGFLRITRWKLTAFSVNIAKRPRNRYVFVLEIVRFIDNDFSKSYIFLSFKVTAGFVLPNYICTCMYVGYDTRIMPEPLTESIRAAALKLQLHEEMRNFQCFDPRISNGFRTRL